MDMLLSIIFVVICSLFKLRAESKDVYIESSVLTDVGETEVVTIKKSELIVGNNLMLKREPRAFHKILDEMGLK